jgi:hypothetical protein
MRRHATLGSNARVFRASGSVVGIGGDDEQDVRRMAASAEPGFRPMTWADWVIGVSPWSRRRAMPNHSLCSEFALSGPPVGSRGIAASPEVEALLFWTGREHVPDTLAAYVQERLRLGTTVTADAIGAACPRCMAQDAPAYNLGCWSHKPGPTAVRNIDNAGNAIGDPRTCSRGPYTVFCYEQRASPDPRRTAVRHASILTSMLLSYPVPCSQNRIASPAWAWPRLARTLPAFADK